MASGEMLRHFAQFHGYQELALTLCKVNDLLNEIKLSGPQRQTHMDDYFLKWTVNCYSFRCISRAYLLLLPVMYFNKMWIWPHPKFIFSRPVLSGHPVLNGHLAIPQGCPLNTGLTVYKYIFKNLTEIHTRLRDVGTAETTRTGTRFARISSRMLTYKMAIQNSIHCCDVIPGVWCPLISCIFLLSDITLQRPLQLWQTLLRTYVSRKTPSSKVR